MKTLISTAGAARRLGISLRTVQRLAKRGIIPASKLEGPNGQYVFEPADLDAYKERENQGTHGHG